MDSRAVHAFRYGPLEVQQAGPANAGGPFPTTRRAGMLPGPRIGVAWQDTERENWQAQGMPEHDPASRDAEQRVQQIITALLEGGSRAANIDLVAETIGMSVRTLQRRLRAIGLTYSDVAQRERRSAAQRLLTDRGAGIGEIARALGYSDPAHFTRAFQRWTGSTPCAFRARMAGVQKPTARRPR